MCRAVLFTSPKIVISSDFSLCRLSAPLRHVCAADFSESVLNAIINTNGRTPTCCPQISMSNVQRVYVCVCERVRCRLLPLVVFKVISRFKSIVYDMRVRLGSFVSDFWHLAVYVILVSGCHESEMRQSHISHFAPYRRNKDEAEEKINGNVITKRTALHSTPFLKCVINGF